MRHQLDLAGRTLSYLDAPNPGRALGTAGRPAEAGDAHLPIVLLLHAFPLAADMWAPQLAAVPSGWRFIAPDFRGFGASSPDADAGDVGAGFSRLEQPSWSIDDYARDALALLDHLQVRQAVVCGISMGGYAALALFRLAPERVRGLVLADTRPDGDSPSARAAREQSRQLVERQGVPALADSMVPRLLGGTSRATRPAIVESVKRLAVAQTRAAVLPAIVRLMTRPDSTPALASITCPTLVVAGDEDEITGSDVARQMHGQVANAALAIIGHAGHLSSVEQPEAFNEALDRFLAARFRL